MSISSTATMPNRLEGETASLRPPNPGELELLAGRIATDPQASPWWGSDAATVQHELADDPDYHVMVVEHDGAPVGVAAFEEELHPDYRHASIDITLLGDAIGRGLGTEALRLLVSWLIVVRGHHRITIDPAVANQRAIAAYRKVGFKPVGTMRHYERGPDGTFHDNLLMDLLAEEFEERQFQAPPEGRLR